MDKGQRNAERETKKRVSRVNATRERKQREREGETRKRKERERERKERTGEKSETHE